MDAPAGYRDPWPILGRSCGLRLLLRPARLLLLPRLGQQSYASQTRANKDELLRSNRLRLEKTYLPLRAELARGMVSFQDLQNLQVGDVMRLDTNIKEQAVVFVEEEPKFLAQPGRIGRKNAVQITQVIDRENEEVYKNKARPIPV